MLNDDALLSIFYVLSLDIAKTYDDIPPWPKWNPAHWWYNSPRPPSYLHVRHARS
ncbi:hypothetical protein BC826DRAFT_1057398 [Russula brevipes]|nr:hypothetical protein BC826DRAFT_1057398 [Russula brevipes]